MNDAPFQSVIAHAQGVIDRCAAIKVPAVLINDHGVVIQDGNGDSSRLGLALRRMLSSQYLVNLHTASLSEPGAPQELFPGCLSVSVPV